MRALRSIHNWRFLVAAAALGATGAYAQRAPELVFDPTWPKDLPDNWKLGGITGLALDRDENVWLYNRPNDLTNIELHAELDPPLALCCVRAPSMIHLDRAGRVIGSFDAPQGHGMDVDSEGFVYLGQDTVRKYTRDPASWLPRSHVRRSARTAVPWAYSLSIAGRDKAAAGPLQRSFRNRRRMPRPSQHKQSAAPRFARSIRPPHR